MRHATPAKKLDKVALVVTFFLLLNIFFNTIFQNTVKNIIASALTLAALIALYRALTKNSRVREAVKRSDTLKSKTVLENLRLIASDKTTDFFQSLLQGAGYDCKVQNGNLMAHKDGINSVVICDFDTPVSAETIYRCERTKNQSAADAFILLCAASTDSAKHTLRRLSCTNSKIICAPALFREMKKQQNYPPCPYDLQPKKQSVWEILGYAFNRARFKSYFLLALIMYLFSFVTIFKTYYIISAAVLFALAAYSIINRRFNARIINFQDEL